MQIRENKRCICLLTFAISLILVVTGLYLWWIHTSWGGGGSGVGRGMGQGLGQGMGRGRGPYIFEGYSLTRFIKDIHLYVGFAFIAAAGLHMACNWKAMKRHLGLLEDTEASRKSGQDVKQSISGDK